MNFDQIKSGNFSSLAGKWTEVAYGPSGASLRYLTGGPDRLFISAAEINNSTEGMRIVGTTLVDRGGPKSLTYAEQGGTLVASLTNQNAAINWTVTFYPPRTQNSLVPTSNGLVDNEHNVIVIWTSNNSYTQVFVEGAPSR